jgi:hypothetical protein
MDIAEDITVFMDIPFIVDITANDHQCRQGLLLLISRISLLLGFSLLSLTSLISRKLLLLDIAVIIDTKHAKDNKNIKEQHNSQGRQRHH